MKCTERDEKGGSWEEREGGREGWHFTQQLLQEWHASSLAKRHEASEATTEKLQPHNNRLARPATTWRRSGRLGLN